MALNVDGLRGVYAFIPTPWNDKGRLAEDVLRHDLEYLCATPVHGVYTPDSAGEFYELEFERFSRLVDIVMDTVDDAKPVQIGCHWTNATGAIRRAEYASSQGADAIRVTFPYWEELSVDEGIKFLEQIAEACHPVPVVYYGTSATSPTLDADAYDRIADEVPGVIGTKLDFHNPLQITEILDRVPSLAHFVSEYVLTQGIAAGAQGTYSWLATTNPDLAVEWYHACSNGDWDRAVEIQRAVLRWSVYRLTKWGFSSTAARTKLDARLNPNFQCPLRVREPFKSPTQSDLAWGRRWLESNEPQLLLGNNGSA